LSGVLALAKGLSIVLGYRAKSGAFHEEMNMLKIAIAVRDRDTTMKLLANEQAGRYGLHVVLTGLGLNRQPQASIMG
jgi:hypothetical protein